MCRVLICRFDFQFTTVRIQNMNKIFKIALLLAAVIVFTSPFLRAQPDPSISMVLVHAGLDSIVISLKFTNNNVMWNSNGMQAAVLYDNSVLIPNATMGKVPIHGLHFAANGWQDYSNYNLFDDQMGYAEGPISGAVTISANQVFNLCKMNWAIHGKPPVGGITSLSFYGNTGSAGSTGYLWTSDPDLRAFSSATGLSNFGYPVELKTFSAVVDGNAIVLSWVTESETNNSGFEIERRYQSGSGNNTEWTPIGFVKGNGTTTRRIEYMSMDFDDHPSGTYQYRLKQIDMDGSYAYSIIAEARVTVNSDVFILSQNYPNPIGNGTTSTWTTIEYTVPMNASSGREIQLTVFDALGRVVEVLVHSIESGGRHSAKFYSGNLPSGLYTYQLRSGSTLLTKRLIIVQ